MKNKFLKTIAFLSVVSILFINVSSVLRYQDDTHTRALFDTFYDLPENSIDVVWLGASAVQSTIIPSEAFDESGIALYTLSSASQPFSFAEYLIKECEKTQDPSLYLIDIRMLAYEKDIADNDIMSDGYVRHVTDNMKFSKNRIDLINYAVSEMQKINPEKEYNLFDYYFSFTKYHTRWSELSEIDFHEDLGAYMGFYYYTGTDTFDKKLTMSRINAAPQPISENNERYLNQVLDYCDSLDKKVVFTCLPSNQEELYFAKYNYVKNIIRERGYEVLDINDYVDEIGLDYASDFCEDMHMNYKGAIKTTDYVAELLSKRYELINHRGETEYTLFTEVQERFVSDIRNLENSLE